ncbi:MAG: hypothetical protein ACI9W6_001902 [Motiliproteus sp.]
MQGDINGNVSDVNDKLGRIGMAKGLARYFSCPTLIASGDYCAYAYAYAYAYAQAQAQAQAVPLRGLRIQGR